MMPMVLQMLLDLEFLNMQIIWQKNQKGEVSFKIHTLPILANMVKIFEASGINFKLLDGFSAETSGES